MEYKALIGSIVIVLTFAGYAPYIFDILKNKTKPHAFTWLTVSITAYIAYALQVIGGGGVGALPMLVVTCICILVFLLSLWRGTRDINFLDAVFLILSLTALLLSLLAKQPILSVFLITISEILGFVPTVRKSWNNPYSETLSLYGISIFRHGLSIVALEQMNILTVLYPAAWTLTNVFITSILIVRRREFAKKI